MGHISCISLTHPWLHFQLSRNILAYSQESFPHEGQKLCGMQTNRGLHESLLLCKNGEGRGGRPEWEWMNKGLFKLHEFSFLHSSNGKAIRMICDPAWRPFCSWLWQTGVPVKRSHERKPFFSSSVECLFLHETLKKVTVQTSPLLRCDQSFNENLDGWCHLTRTIIKCTNSNIGLTVWNGNS